MEQVTGGRISVGMDGGDERIYDGVRRVKQEERCLGRRWCASSSSAARSLAWVATMAAWLKGPGWVASMAVQQDACGTNELLVESPQREVRIAGRGGALLGEVVFLADIEEGHVVRMGLAACGHRGKAVGAMQQTAYEERSIRAGFDGVGVGMNDVAKCGCELRDLARDVVFTDQDEARLYGSGCEHVGAGCGEVAVGQDERRARLEQGFGKGDSGRLGLRGEGKREAPEGDSGGLLGAWREYAST